LLPLRLRILHPIVSQGENVGLTRPLAAIGAILIVTLALVAFLAFVIPDLWEQGTKASQKISSNFNPEKAARQRAVLKRYWPVGERLAGDQIEKFLSDPAVVVGSTAMDAGGGKSGLLSVLVSSLDLLLGSIFCLLSPD